MSNYILGAPQDYIPQIQSWQPDYNFLGNVMQTKQSQYDKGYHELNKSYSTLLNSPMLRKDNNKQRDEFFKVINSDVKRISGLDLSRQENVDAANKVFSSFYQNKSMVKDMTYTKEYQNQLQILENYRNCINQEECGGKYSDEGARYLHYKADEFKNASKEEAMSMTPGRATPMINIQERATKYVQGLLGKSGEFGIQTVVKSKDGRYNVTLKNGQLLEVPLQHLLLAQYGNDQDIKDMFNVKTFVNRKDFIENNASRFNGNKDAAEDLYFNQVDREITNARQTAEKAKQESDKHKIANQLVEQKIKKEGSTGSDSLAKDFFTTGLASAVSSAASDHHDSIIKTADSIFDAKDNRQMKRQRVDATLADIQMTKDIGESATRVAVMTGQVTQEADPYAKSAFDSALKKEEMKLQAELTDQNNLNQSIYNTASKLVTDKKVAKPGVDFPNLPGTFLPGKSGTSTPDIEGGLADEVQAEITQFAAQTTRSQQAFLTDYTNTLKGVLSNPHADSVEKAAAKMTLDVLYGKGGTENPNNITISKRYELANQMAKTYNTASYNTEFMGSKGAGTKHKEYYELLQQQKDVSEIVVKENNGNVRIYGSSYLKDQLEKHGSIDNWDNFFNADNSTKTRDQYQRWYDSKHPGGRVEGGDVYDKINSIYKKVYSSGTIKGKDSDNHPVPLVKPIHTNTALGGLSGGKTSGAMSYGFTTENKTDVQRLATMYEDSKKSGSIVTIDNQVTLEDAEGQSELDKQDARDAYNALINDIRIGKEVTGDYDYMDTALSDPNMVGMHIKFSQDFLNAHKGTDKNQTWADRISASKGIAVYVPKAVAENTLTQSYKAKPYDTIIAHKDVKISFPDAGNITINKADVDGNIGVNAVFEAYGIDDKGKLTKTPVPVDYTYRDNPSGQNVYNGYYMWGKEIADRNANVLEHIKNNTPLIYDPAKLPNIQEAINQAAGDSPAPVDWRSTFMSTVSDMKQQMRQ